MRPVTSPGEILWGVNHDNNHVLNSLWIYLVGVDARSMTLRALAIICGAATVAVAATAGRRPAALAFALMTAVSVTFVHFGSEARGYAGLMFSIVAAIVAYERWHAGDERSAPWILGGAIALGVLSHLTMLAAGAAVGFASLVSLLRRGRPWRDTEARFLRLIRPALFLTMPVLLAQFWGVIQSGFTVGGIDPFTWPDAVDGYGRLLSATLGLPESTPTSLALLSAGGVLALTGFAVRRTGSEHRFILGCITLLLLPGTMAMARLPNLGFPRYHLLSGVVLLWLVAHLTGAAWRRGGFARIIGCATLIFILTGSALRLAQESGERGRYSEAIAHMARRGPVILGSDHDLRNPMLLDFHAPRIGVSVHTVPRERWCEERPVWFIVSDDVAPAEVTLPTAACRLAYRLDATFAHRGFSGATWALYTRTTP